MSSSSSNINKTSTLPTPIPTSRKTSSNSTTTMHSTSIGTNNNNSNNNLTSSKSRPHPILPKINTSPTTTTTSTLTAEDDLANYLNEDVLLSAGPEGGDHDHDHDHGMMGMSLDMDMDLDMEMGMSMGNTRMSGMDGGMSWIKEEEVDDEELAGREGGMRVSGEKVMNGVGIGKGKGMRDIGGGDDAFLSGPHFPMPFSPSSPHTIHHFNNIHSSPQSGPITSFHPSMSLISSFPAVTPPINMAMSMPGNGSFFPSSSNLPLSNPLSPHTLPSTFGPNGEPPSFNFLSSGGNSIPGMSSVNGFDSTTIPGAAFLHQPLQQGPMMDGSNWDGMMALNHGDGQLGSGSTLPLGKSFVQSTSTSAPMGKNGKATTKHSKRRTSASSTSTKVSAGTGTAPSGCIAPTEIITKVKEEEGQDDLMGSMMMMMNPDQQEKRPSKRQRCDSEDGSVDGSSSTRSVSSFDGFGSMNGSSFLGHSMEGLGGMSLSFSTLNGEGGNPTVKMEEEDGPTELNEDGTIKKKKKPFKPWNVSPASSHLPSGSACINPVTGEVELPPLDNLTKEEIRKVKNRASAQRSRTRKVEWASGLREENDKLRGEIEVLRAGMEGALAGGGAGGGGASIGKSSSDSIEKDSLKALIKTLRSELHSEKTARERIQADLLSLRAQLDSAKSKGAMTTGLPSPERSGSEGAEGMRDFGRDQEEAERGELLNSVAMRGKREMKVMKKDGKGVLMMVVLFSFALFSMPPNLRSSTFSAAFPSRLTESANPGQSTMIGRVLPFDDILISNRTTDDPESEMTCTDASAESALAGKRGNEPPTEEEAKCPAPMGPQSKFQRMEVALSRGQGMPGSFGSGMKGRKSLSLTLLKPYDKESSIMDQRGEVEDVLEKWLGLSLFDEEGMSGTGTKTDNTSDGGETPTARMPGAWVVVKAMPSSTPLTEEEDENVEDSQSTVPSGIETPLQSVKAWDGSEIEPMDLDSELLTISAGSGADTVGVGSFGPSPFQPDLRKGFEATLAPELKSIDELLESQTTKNSQRASDKTNKASIPVSKPAGRRASDASTTSTISVPARAGSAFSTHGAGVSIGAASRQAQAPPSAALMALTSTQTAATQAQQITHLQEAEQYVKLELEVDLEMELTCKAVRRRRGTVSDIGSGSVGGELGEGAGAGVGGHGFTLVGREELGRMFDGADAFKGSKGDFLSLEV